jgi:hypothetical protein
VPARSALSHNFPSQSHDLLTARVMTGAILSMRAIAGLTAMVDEAPLCRADTM